jgi:Domain of unknown function (DUF5666)
VLYEQEESGHGVRRPHLRKRLKKEIPMSGSNRVAAILLFVPLFILAGCGGGSSSGGFGSLGVSPASVFTVATDAALPSVVSCQLTINSVTLANGGTNFNVLSQPATIDFAKLSGLHQLIDLTSVPPGTYTSAMLTLASPVIEYLDTSAVPPVIRTLNGTLSQTSVTVSLAQPFVLNADDTVGLRMEFDIPQSLAIDGSGQITGTLNPTFHMQLLSASDANVSIDEFRGGFVSQNSSTSFVMQGPRGRQWTVTTDNNTDFDTGDLINSFTTNTVVDVSGQLNAVTHSIEASEVAVLSTDKFILGGLLTSVWPPTGPATAVDLFVRTELPDITGVQAGQITTLGLNDSEVYRIANVPLPFTTIVFNNSSLAAGQRVAIGGLLNGATLIPRRVVLMRQGQVGTWVTGSTRIIAGNNGSFQLNANSTAGVLLPSPLTVLTTGNTRFLNLPNGLASLSASNRIRVVGFILINPNDPYSGIREADMVARAVEQLTP